MDMSLAKGPWEAQVRGVLLDGQERPKQFAAVAHDLGVSQRTLRRRLDLENTSFRRIRAQILAERAVGLLQQGELTHDEIAARLGLSDGANFRQAFRRWTGCSTRQFGQHKGAED